MNAVLDYLATKPRWAIDVAVWVPFLGLWAATLIRADEILRDEDMPPIPAPAPVTLAAPAAPVTIDLGLYGPDLDALEATQ